MIWAPNREIWSPYIICAWDCTLLPFTKVPLLLLSVIVQLPRLIVRTAWCRETRGIPSIMMSLVSSAPIVTEVTLLTSYFWDSLISIVNSVMMIAIRVEPAYMYIMSPETIDFPGLILRLSKMQFAEELTNRHRPFTISNWSKRSSVVPKISWSKVIEWSALSFSGMINSWHPQFEYPVNIRLIPFPPEGYILYPVFSL